MSRSRAQWADSRPYLGEVARSLLGVLLAVAFALQWAAPVAAIAAGAGAAVAGAAALQDKPHGRVPSTLGVSAGMGAAAFVGTLSAPHGVVFILVVALWSVGAGLMWAISANAGLVAAATGALLVSCGHESATVTDAATAGVLAVVGGVTQVALVAAWPRQRWQRQREALAAAYRTVAAGARQLADDPAAVVDVSTLVDLRDAHTVTERQARRQPPAVRGLYALPERIAMTLTAIRSGSSDPATRDVLLTAADVLESIGGRVRGFSGGTDRPLTDVELAVERLPASAVACGRRLLIQLGEAAALRSTGMALLRNRGRQAQQALRAQLSWDSPVARHAVRLGGAAGLGTAIAVLSGMEQGYWVALTVLLVLRPETAHTYTRCVIRVLGNTAGIALATSVTVLWHPSGFAAAMLAVLFVAIAYAVAGISYVPLTAAAAAAIVFLLDIGGTAGDDMLGERLVATVIGGALAIGSHVLLPDRSLVRLRQRSGELLKAEIDYAATVIRAFVHPLTDADAAISANWERAVRARSAFEAAGGSARADAPSIRRWLVTYRAGLNAVTGSCAVLETQVAEAHPETLDRRFVVAVDDYVDALRGEIPRAGQAWSIDAAHLTATEQQLRESAALLGQGDTAQRMLVTEVETITRHLLAMAAAET
ncbi:MAG: FUSC family protein [Mycobacterium sp.]